MTDVVLTRADDILNIANEFEGVVVGRAGNDTIAGGSGNDVIYGDNNSSGSVSTPRPNGFQILESRTATITFQGETAGYMNSFGMYKVDSEGKFTAVNMLFGNASQVGSGGNLVAGRSYVNVDLVAGDMIGFFIAPNAFGKSGALMNRTDGTWEFRDSSGKAASMKSGTDVHLWFVPKDGSPAVKAATQDGRLFFARDSMNYDNLSHVRTLADEKTGIVKLGFEDLLNGGDKDFDDVRVSIDVGINNLESFPSTKFFSEAASDDILRGGAGKDTIYGGSGKDQIWGGIDNDSLFGGTGDDQIWGEDGNDAIDGGAANDRMWGGKGNDTINGAHGNDQLSGDDGDDKLTGGHGDDQFWDGAGNDSVSGASGLDLVRVGKGDDKFNGGDGFDTLDYVSASGAVDVNLGKKVSTGGGLGVDSLKSFEGVIGSRFGDKLTGNSVDNTLNGAAGNDTIRGGVGNDTLIGGAGNDTFLWASRSDIRTKTGFMSTDVIKDFDIANDKLDFEIVASRFKGDKSARFATDETDLGTMIKIDLGPTRGGWHDAVMLEGIKLGDNATFSASWLDV
jgi:serralysin